MQHHLRVPLKASYHTLNTLSSETERIWVVFHGYGQLAAFFIKKFEGLDAQKNFIIAPQGLSKYYLQGVQGRVGASWMTKEDRLTEIENQHSYLDAVLSAFDFEGKELIYFGFSQGTATMGRYAAHAKRPFHKMIIWAGTFPPDTDPKDWSYLSGSESFHYYTSKEDIYFKEDLMPQQDETIKTAVGRAPILHWYEGGHKVVPALLKEI